MHAIARKPAGTPFMLFALELNNVLFEEMSLALRRPGKMHGIFKVSFHIGGKCRSRLLG